EERVMRTTAVLALAAVFVGPAFAQQAAKPGPEHKLLKKRVGTWTTTMKAGDNEHKGTVTYKMELGGLWLTGSMDSDLGGGQKFSGRSMDTYDAKKKKYVGVWFDSMSTTPMTMEGDLSKDGKLTLVGDGVGMDGKPAKWKSVSTMPDDDTIDMK